MTLGRSPKLFFAGLAVLVLTTSYLGVQRGADPETRFRDALHKQQVEGDLNGAMEIYREIVASPNAGRAVKAKALLQLAGSLETLGKQAETVYQRILKEFEDQPAASQARSRLAALKSSAPAALTLTQIRFGATVQNVVATDGQRAVYWDPERTTLYIGDVAGRSRTRIFTTTAQRRPRAEVSRDLSMVFLYFVATGSKASTSYAIIRTDGSGSYREVDLKDKRFDLSLPLYGVSWSFDNRYIVLCKMGEDRIVRPLRLSVDDGQMTELLPGHPTSIGSAVLSPDGRSIALQGLIAGGVFQDVYVKPMQGGELERAAELSILADWTSDGRHLVFASQQNQAPRHVHDPR